MLGKAEPTTLTTWSWMEDSDKTASLENKLNYYHFWIFWGRKGLETEVVVASLGIVVATGNLEPSKASRIDRDILKGQFQKPC